MIVRDFLICLLQMYLLEDQKISYYHTEEKTFWENFSYILS